MIRGIYKSCIHNDKYIAVFPNGSKWSDVSLMMKILFLLTDLSVDLTSVGRAWTLTQFTTTSWQVPGGNTMFYRYADQFLSLQYIHVIVLVHCIDIVFLHFENIKWKRFRNGFVFNHKELPSKKPREKFLY